MRLRELLDADWRRLQEVSGAPSSPRRWSSSFSPRFASVVLLRIAQRLEARGWRRTARIVSFINFLVFNIEAPSRLRIGPGLVLPHPQGIVLGAAHIGSNVTIFHQVTLGARLVDFSYDLAQRPHVCDGVVIAVGAKIMGPIRIGARALIGANAVVLGDVPEDCVAVGVPARIVERTKEGDGSTT